jgi:hypothetical protein
VRQQGLWELKEPSDFWKDKNLVTGRGPAREIDRGLVTGRVWESDPERVIDLGAWIGPPHFQRDR